jgi:hypothetical protein
MSVVTRYYRSLAFNPHVSLWKRAIQMAPVMFCLDVTWSMCDGAIRGVLSSSFIFGTVAGGLVVSIPASFLYAVLEMMKYQDRWWEIFSRPAESGKGAPAAEGQTDQSKL